MKTPVMQIVQEYKSALEGILHDELLGVRLYGSQVRSEAGEASDIDILLIMKNTFDYGALSTGHPKPPPLSALNTTLSFPAFSSQRPITRTGGFPFL